MNLELSPVCSRYIGIPYRDKGRGPGGWDCWGLVYYLSREFFGHRVPAYLDDYESAENEESVNRTILTNSKDWRPIELGQEVPGDVVIFNLAGYPLHAGLVIQAGFMLHCLRGRDTVKECYLTNAWRHRIAGFYRWIT